MEHFLRNRATLPPHARSLQDADLEKVRKLGSVASLPASKLSDTELRAQMEV